ncbi:MAG TPA: methyltransferase domain-containing protein [Vicinamibacterales bacterium]
MTVIRLRRELVLAGILLGCLSAFPHAQSQQQDGHPGRLFPPSDLGLLDAPDRDLWQRPDQIMDALGIADASVVADIGAGSGWFTIRLARRVGPRGIVFAEDVQKEMIAAITRRASREGLSNVKPVLGLKNDPRIPQPVDAVLIVDAYHEVEDRVAMLTSLARSLKPQGRLGVIDFKLDGTGPGPSAEERVSPDVVIRDAQQAGLRLIRQEPFLQYQYFLIFGK